MVNTHHEKEKNGEIVVENSFINHFYVGRIYQYYLDNEKDLVSKGISDLGFLIPKKDGIEITKIKNLVKGLLQKEGIVVKCYALPKGNGWRFSFSLAS